MWVLWQIWGLCWTSQNSSFTHCSCAQSMREIKWFGSFCVTADKTKCFGTEWIFSFFSYSNLGKKSLLKILCIKVTLLKPIIGSRRSLFSTRLSVCDVGVLRRQQQCHRALLTPQLCRLVGCDRFSIPGIPAGSWCGCWGQCCLLLKEGQNLFLPLALCLRGLNQSLPDGSAVPLMPAGIVILSQKYQITEHISDHNVQGVTIQLWIISIITIHICWMNVLCFTNSESPWITFSPSTSWVKNYLSYPLKLK